MYDAILIATDASDPARTAADHAIDLARTHGAELHALYVVDQTYDAIAGWDIVVERQEREGEEALDGIEARGRERGVEVVKRLRRGVPDEQIIEYVDDYGIDLVVMGTAGRTGLERLAHPGSTTTRVLRRTSIPVVAVPRADEG